MSGGLGWGGVGGAEEDGRRSAEFSSSPSARGPGRVGKVKVNAFPLTSVGTIWQF